MINLWNQRLLVWLPCLLCTLASVSSFAQTEERESLTKPVYRVERVASNPASPSATKVDQSLQQVKQSVESTAVPAQIVPPHSPIKVAQTVKPLVKEVQTTTLPAKDANDVEQLAALESGNPEKKPVVKTEAKKTLDLATRDARIALENLKKNVLDYRCDFIKRERIGGRLRPTEQVKLLVRNHRDVSATCKECTPLGVYMKFLGPRDCKNREVLFVEGANNGKMLVKEGGTRGRFLPSVWLSPNGTFASSSSRYPITEVGLVRLTERLIESAESNTCDEGECKVKYIKGAKVDGRQCSYLEVIRAVKKPNEPLGPNNIYLAQVFLDEEMKLPIRYAAYDWPSVPGGKPKLVEEYTYRQIELNVGLCEKDFSPKNPQYKF